MWFKLPKMIGQAGTNFEQTNASMKHNIYSYIVVNILF